MKRVSIHAWPASQAEARALQAAAALQVECHPNTPAPRMIAAVDTDYGFAGQYLYAAAVVLTFPELQEVDRASATMRVTFPYVPGLLYFREGPVIVEALCALASDAAVILVASHGIAHSRRCGLACQIGLDFDRPTIGCARKLLDGQHRLVSATKGSFEPIVLHGHEVGCVYRSKENVKPIYISPGHKCDLAYARDTIVRSLRGFRMPEPLRIAHVLATHARRRHELAAGGPVASREHRNDQAGPGRK